MGTGVSTATKGPTQAAEARTFRAELFQHEMKSTTQKYLVDNRVFKAITDGVGYRFTKRLEDLDPSFTALWGSFVEGVDEGDGWLKIAEDLYLPTSWAVLESSHVLIC